MCSIRPIASLRTYLIVPFSLILLSVMGLVGWLSLRNSQHAVNDLGQQLRGELAARITQHLDDYLLRAQLAANVTVDAVQRGELRPRDAKSERYLWKLLQIFPTASWIYYGEESTGDFIGISRHEPEKALWLVISDPTTGREITYYDTDAYGNRVSMANEEPGVYDPRPRPWYTAAVRAGHSHWSEIYPDWGTGRLVISLGAPAYDEHADLLGVCTIDIFLDDISAFLRGIDAGENGKIFIIDRNGDIVATSTAESPSLRPDGAAEAQRLPMVSSQDELIAATGAYMLGSIEPQQIVVEQEFDFEIAGRRQLGQVVPYHDGRGLDWLIVIVMPEADLMGQVVAGTHQTLALVIGLGPLAALAGWWMVNRITHPLVQLTQAAGAIAQGNLAQRVDIHGADEVGVLANTFNRMAADLSQSFELLEERVRQRTTELHEVNQTLRDEKVRLEQYNRQRELLAAMTDQLQANLTVAEANQVVSTYLRLLFPERDGALYLLNAAGTLEPGAVWGGDTTLDTAFPPNDCCALRCGKPYRFRQGLPNPPCPPGAEDIAHGLCLPLAAQGERLGCLHIATRGDQEAETIAGQEQRLLETVADSVALALANVRLREQLRKQSILDGLTGLFNRRYLDEALPREIHRAERDQAALCVLMFDIDYFKQFNDTYGHDAGDVVLRQIADLLLASFRFSDIACRYGGEEFVIVLPDTGLEVAAARAETLRKTIAQLSVQHNGADLGGVTISVGVAAYPRHGATRDALIKCADAAAYGAKKAGRNRVEMAPCVDAAVESPGCTTSKASGRRT